MYTPKPLMMLGVTLALSAALFPAALQAQSPFARSLADFSSADRAAMDRARGEVLAKMEQGAVSTWKDASTGHSGVARLVRTFERNGMRCAEVEHAQRIPRPSHFVVPFCRGSDGTWRAAF